jgi:hypothetical protein
MQHTLDYSSARAPLGRRLLTVMHRAALLSPLLIPLGVYGAWLVAWVAMGTRPRPSFDDPKDVLGVVYYASLVPVYLMPLGIAAAIGSIVARFAVERLRSKAFAWALCIGGLWIAVVALLRWDPYMVGDWWMD